MEKNEGGRSIERKIAYYNLDRKALFGSYFTLEGIERKQE